MRRIHVQAIQFTYIRQQEQATNKQQRQQHIEKPKTGKKQLKNKKSEHGGHRMRGMGLRKRGGILRVPRRKRRATW
jgi:hypothetical protein